MTQPLRVQEFTAASLKVFRGRLQEVLDRFGADYGLKIELEGRMAYSQSSVNFRCEARVATPEGSKSRQQLDFERLAPGFGLTAADWRREFTWNGKRWALVGFNLQAVKYPFDAENLATGKTYRLPPSALPEAAAHAGFGPRTPLFATVPISVPLPGESNEEFRRRAYPHLYNPDGSRKDPADRNGGPHKSLQELL